MVSGWKEDELSILTDDELDNVADSLNIDLDNSELKYKRVDSRGHKINRRLGRYAQEKEKKANLPVKINMKRKSDEIKNNVPTVIVRSDSSEELINNSLLYATVYDKDGNPICGQKRKDEKSLCKRTAGWGTEHFGWGSCKDHDLTKQAEVIYLDAISDDDLREFVELHSEGKELLSNNEDELVVARALLRMRLVQLNSKDVLSVEGRTAYKDVQTSLKLIDSMLLTQNELRKTTRDMIPRDVVIGYFAKVTSILQQELRNVCIKCGGYHNMRDLVVSKLELLGPIGVES